MQHQNDVIRASNNKLSRYFKFNSMSSCVLSCREFLDASIKNFTREFKKNFSSLSTHMMFILSKNVKMKSKHVAEAVWKHSN